jgi:MFS family permease
MASPPLTKMTIPGTKQAKWLFTEFGLTSLFATGRDAWLIILTRCLRMFAYGTNALITALFFNALKFSDYQIGLFMTLTLLGDVALSFCLTLVADRVGRRNILLAGAALMVASGATFAIFENFWILLIAAVVGVISPTGSEIGPFRAVEESTISHLTTPDTRSDVLAWYVTTATLGSSIGTAVCGLVVSYLESHAGWTTVQAYHTVFWIYSLTGAVNICLILLMSSNCEESGQKDEGYMMIEDTETDEEQPSSSDPATKAAPIKPTKKPGFFSQISPESRIVLFKLSLLFSLDSLGGGMTPWSLVNYYLTTKFNLPSATLGSINSACFMLSAVSTLFAAPLAKRIGLLPTMILTHFPSSLALAAIPLPSSAAPTFALMLFRASLSAMDQAPRAAFVAAIVRPEERTAVMGINSTLRTLAQSAGPSFTGVLAGDGRFAWAFFAAGSCKASYDLGLWIWGMKIKLHVHEKGVPRASK